MGLRVKHMKLAVNLSLPMVADVMTAIGVPVDERNVGRALQAVSIPGVEAPDGPGGRWRIPRRRLADVAAACLLRRRRRSHDRTAYTLEGCLLDAAALIMRHHELHQHVPRRLAEAVTARREARLRAQRERQRRTEETERRRLKEQREAWRRQQARERAERERWARKRAEEEHERVMDECYRLCFRQAYKAIGSPQGAHWPELPEAVQLRRDFPHDRPARWAPPGMFEKVKEYMAARARWYLAEEPDWSRWVPEYVPNRPWPWRQPESDDDADPAR
jgi:hypothetical protein